jgi:hypothetical protein
MEGDILALDKDCPGAVHMGQQMQATSRLPGWSGQYLG